MVRVNIKFAVAGAAVLFGLAAGMTAAYAAPRNSDCVNCTRSRYDNEEVIQKIRNARGSAEVDPVTVRRDEAPLDRDSSARADATYRDGTPARPETYRDSAPRNETYRDSASAPRTETYRDTTPSTPAPRTETYRDGGSRTETYRDGGRTEECRDCPPPRKYDSQEVVKSSHDIDKSDVINTTTVVPVAPRYREQNHLVVHENETRLVGTVQHNNLIVEKEIRYVKRPPVYRPVHYVVRHYPVYRPQYVYVPAPRPTGCGCNPPPPPPCGNCGGLLQLGYYGY